MTRDLDTIEQARAKIVAGLNLGPVPPDSSNEDLAVMDDAWSALHELLSLLVAKDEALREIEAFTMHIDGRPVDRLWRIQQSARAALGSSAADTGDGQ